MSLQHNSKDKRFEIHDTLLFLISVTCVCTRVVYETNNKTCAKMHLFFHIFFYIPHCCTPLTAFRNNDGF